MPKLTPKQERFVQEYLVDLNGTDAATRAGYSKRTAYSIANELLKKPHVQAAVQAAQAERGKRVKRSADDVVLELERLAMFDPKDLTDVKGPEDIKALPEDVRRAIVGWSWDRQGRFTIKLAKEGALEMLGRHHGVFRDRIEHTGKDGKDLPAAVPAGVLVVPGLMADTGAWAEAAKKATLPT